MPGIQVWQSRLGGPCRPAAMPVIAHHADVAGALARRLSQA
ncbi:hypothetical protein [Streptosporangium sp. 'caverna']|nr:hypothetical protein [Streptosporangium sp. 'caverna']